MLAWSDDLGKRVRAGDWADQSVSTVTKIEEAVAGGRGEEAAQLVDYFMEEAKVVYLIYEIWMAGFVEWLGLQGVSDAERDAELGRLQQLLALPDGRAFEPLPVWEALGAAAGVLASRLRIGRGGEGLDALREGWRVLHDRYVDLISGLLAYIARRFGEAALEPCYRHVLEPYIEERYMPFDLRERDYEQTLFRNLYTTFEAMRAHLCGPGRRGDLEFEEDDDKWVVKFDPCGSGGRSSRGDPVEGTPPRPQPPYELASPPRSTTGRGTRRASVTTARTAASRSSSCPQSAGATPCAGRFAAVPRRDRGPRAEAVHVDDLQAARRDPRRGLSPDRADKADRLTTSRGRPRS